MAKTVSEDELVGRGAREGRRLFDAWYAELTDAAERGVPAAYVFVMGSLVELLRVFDLPVVFPEINSLQTAVRKVSDGYLSEAEDHGFSPDVCGYVKADYALQLRGGEHPRGRIPPPAIAVLTNACNTYIKWAEIWERLHDIPVATIDVPMTRGSTRYPLVKSSTADDDRDRRYIRGQLEELIELLESVTGRPFDEDRLRDTLRWTNEMGHAYRRVLELNRSRPAVFDAVMEGTIFLGVANAHRGTEAGARYFQELVEEMEHRVERGISALGEATEERYRLAFVGVPCYPIFSDFQRLFSDWGGVFVGSSYLWFASGGLNLEHEYDLEHPLDALADGVLAGVRMATDSMIFQDDALLRSIEEYGLDGVVYHPVKSCRTVSTGLASSRKRILEESDALALYIESDMMDPRVVSVAQLKNRIDAFFEGLDSRKVRLDAVEATVGGAS
ncbi:MAG: 2-hydroxyacyl-CoA dehydratase family protein [Longimicrobiales bacterium]|nr:2-hydroxyacyl-CoA dehydratase family protein [Longimicrobiales bacterium]